MKKITAFLFCFILALSFCSCNKETVDNKAKWSVYWYLCGSDLESNYGCASTDLLEAMQVSVPDNVNVIIETGGSEKWHTEGINADMLQRWKLTSEGLELIEEVPSASMGEAETLRSFLEFASENYPAEKTAVTFWNHGGGSIGGAEFDELYGNDSLTLTEMREAFTSVFDESTENPPLELIGFDTCLMATVDVAYTFSDIANYMVASEECEPGNGWYYTTWLQKLCDEPDMNGSTLGKIICDSYYEGCVAEGTEAQSTLSLVDLTKIESLLSAYEQFGVDALSLASQDAGFLAKYSKIAVRSENYGGNTREQGYTNMVDLGHLAGLSMDLIPSASSVLDALDRVVLYKVNGEYRSESSGLSCFHSYNGDIDNLNGFITEGYSTAFKYLYRYALTGELGEDGAEYLSSVNVGTLPETISLNDTEWDGIQPEVDENGTAYITLGSDAVNVLSDIQISLFYIDTENDLMFYMGSDNDINSDWDNGVFGDNFRGVWGALNETPVYMEIYFQGEGYNLYSVPVLINGGEYNLQVAYDFDSEEWSVLGACKGLEENGMASKEMYQLQIGDEISILWQVGSVSNAGEFEMQAVASIIVDEDTVFGEAELGDGQYGMVFTMWDAVGNEAMSEAVIFTVEDGVITTSV